MPQPVHFGPSKLIPNSTLKGKEKEKKSAAQRIGPDLAEEPGQVLSFLFRV